MPDDDPSTSGAAPRSWLDRLSQALSGEPQNRADLMHELKAAMKKGLLDADTLRMVEGALTVSDKQVADVMVPRARMVMLAVDAPLEQNLITVIESGHSRFPVHGDSTDEILGVLLAKDLLRCLARPGQPCELQKLMRPVQLIPESKRLNLLLKDFRSNRNHMAVVVDEFGGVAGLVTIEDVLEEIVGEIDDEHDAEDRPEVTIVELPDHSWAVQAQTPIEDFNAHFGVRLDDDLADTIGGLVSATIGHLPEAGEVVTLDRFRIEIVKADSRRLHALRVRLLTA